LNTVDEDGDHVKLSGTSTGSGLTPSLTELGVGKVDDHPSSSRYMDAGEAARYEDELETQQMHHGHQLQQHQHQTVDVLPKLEETEEDLQRSQRSQHYHLEASAHELLSDAPDADQYDEHQHEHELEDHHQTYDQSATLIAPQVDEDDWLCLTKEQAYLAHAELNDVRSRFVDEVDELDCTMVAEYADEIFALMGQLEVSRGRVLCIQLR
jgi:hypothetical protein